MSDRTLSDGSVASIQLQHGYISVTRTIRTGELVFAQNFAVNARNDETTQGPFAFAADVVDQMDADPDSFHRWWLW